MDNATVFLTLIMFGATAFGSSYFVMKQVASYTNGSLKKSKFTDERVETLSKRTQAAKINSTKLHAKIKTI